MTNFSCRPVVYGLPALIALSLVSCKKPEITYYEVPKEETKQVENALPASTLPPNHPTITPSPGGGSNMSDPAMANLIPAPDLKSGTGLSWSTVDHWVEGRSSSMRLGSYTVAEEPTLDISITRFPGDVGGLLSNVNRWRGQIGLGSIGAEALNSEVRQRTTPEFTFEIVHMHNPANSQKTLVALLNLEGNTWFFKMSGPSNAVDQEENAFFSLVDSVAREKV